ncbi:MAG: hypothetical protein R3D84_15365 [Paracoccaceae bacterium]
MKCILPTTVAQSPAALIIRVNYSGKRCGLKQESLWKATQISLFRPLESTPGAYRALPHRSKSHGDGRGGVAKNTRFAGTVSALPTDKTKGAPVSPFRLE